MKPCANPSAEAALLTPQAAREIISQSMKRAKKVVAARLGLLLLVVLMSQVFVVAATAILQAVLDLCGAGVSLRRISGAETP